MFQRATAFLWRLTGRSKPTPLQVGDIVKVTAKGTVWEGYQGPIVAISNFNDPGNDYRVYWVEIRILDFKVPQMFRDFELTRAGS